MLKSLLSILISCVVYGSCNASEGLDSWLVRKCVYQQSTDTTVLLPDFSYAGYHYGEDNISPQGTVFDVTDYGAVPNDNNDDLYQIHKTISAAKANGGGIVYLPPGKYVVNPYMSQRRRLVINSSNITIRGAGAYAGGTIIHMVQPFGGGDPLNSARLHLNETLFLVITSNQTSTKVPNQNVLCNVTGDSPSQSFSVTVDDTQNISVGNYVLLYAKNQTMFENLVEPYDVDSAWTSITSNNAYAVEIHKIKAIEGTKVTFHEPLVYDVESQYGWELREHHPITEVGFEDICFMGNANQRYVHHRSSIDNSGWSMIKMLGVADGFIRRCTFINCSQAVYVGLSSNISMLNLLIAGNPTHHGARSVYFNYGNFGAYIIDMANCTHGPSVSSGAVNTVYYRSSSPGGIDCHSGRPIASLFDNVSGGRMHSSGGLRDFPQHLRNLVLWNCHNDDPEVFTYDFWQPILQNVFVKPNIFGFHGQIANFVTETVGILESNGERVKPDSLYEEQIKARIGKLPDWLVQAQADSLAMLTQTLPDYFDISNPYNCQYDLFPETFKVNDMLSFLCSLSFEFNTQLYTYTCADTTLSLTTDQSFLRNAVYALMYCIYKRNEPGNTVVADVMNDGVDYVRFTITSPVLTSTITSFDGDEDYECAQVFAEIVDAEIEYIYHSNYYELVLLIPLN